MVERSTIKERSPYMTPYEIALDASASQIYEVRVAHNYLGFFFVFFFCMLHPMLPVSMDCQGLIGLRFFSNVYSIKLSNLKILK